MGEVGRGGGIGTREGSWKEAGVQVREGRGFGREGGRGGIF